MKYCLFIGRWQPFHKGHMWLVNQQLEKGKPVCIAVRDVQPDEQNPLKSDEVVEMLRFIFSGNEGVKVIKIPDIESVNYGRGVGYEIIEHDPPTNIERISATAIRKMLKSGDDGWQKFMPNERVIEWMKVNIHLFEGRF